VRDISKVIFLNAGVCPTLAWFQRHGVAAPRLSEGERFLLEQGREIGLKARRLFPDGVLVDEDDVSIAAETTRRLVADPAVTTIFEPAFRVEDCVGRADIITRVERGWQVIEVKSGTSASAQYVRDLAYTTMVVGANGLPAVSSVLALVSREYRLGMDDARFFRFEDCTDAIRASSAAMEKARPAVQSVTAGRRPLAKLKRACRECPYFDSHCLGIGRQHDVLDLPRLTKTGFAKLEDAKIASIAAIPPGFGLTPAQERVRASVVSGQPWVSRGLRRDLEEIAWPAFYLDFETVNAAVPLYPDVAPYTQIPFQYSLDIRDAPGGPVEHRDFLADPRRDCRRDLIDRLLADAGADGSIVVYSSFEKTVLNGLADLFPDLRADVQALVIRLVDLKAIFEKHYYHPSFRGSYSIKVVLPVLVPGLSYDDLVIADGSTASAAFARMAHAVADVDEERRLRSDLLAYCGRDTIAMARLHDALLALA
jgi:predicted RecB family nuclease